jgi:hypothetical protein
MPNLQAKVRFPYGKKVLQVGETFEASEKIAKLLKGMGKAEDATEITSRTDLPKEVMKRAPKKEAAEEPAPLAPTYQRRDMQATGQTGEEKPAPSSRRGRRPKVFGSTAFEEDD